MELRYKVSCFLLKAGSEHTSQWGLQLAHFSCTRSPGLLCFPKVLSSTCSSLCHHVLFLRTAFQPVAGFRVSDVLASLNLSSLVNKMSFLRGLATAQVMIYQVSSYADPWSPTQTQQPLRDSPGRINIQNAVTVEHTNIFKCAINRDLVVMMKKKGLGRGWDGACLRPPVVNAEEELEPRFLP